MLNIKVMLSGLRRSRTHRTVGSKPLNITFRFIAVAPRSRVLLRFLGLSSDGPLW